MSESMQVTPPVSAGAPKAKVSPLESTNTPVSNEESGSFNEVLANYSELENDTAEQSSDDTLIEMDEVLPQEMLENGNDLPQQDKTIMWQALFLLQPDKAVSSTPITTIPSQLQNLSLLDGQRKLTSNATFGNQDYFNTMLLQNKDTSNSLPTGFTGNNISMQLAASHFIPESNDALLLNMNEQILPIQSPNSAASQSLSAVGFGTAIQAANTQTQMAPLNLRQNAWQTNLSSRLQMMIGQNVQSAEIRLDPPELGTLDIKIKITNDVASVNITSAHAQVRDALETALPKLREMFAETGVELGDVNVRQESFAQQQNSNEEKKEGMYNPELDNVEEIVTVNKQISNDGLLDIYA